MKLKEKKRQANSSVIVILTQSQGKKNQNDILFYATITDIVTAREANESHRDS